MERKTIISEQPSCKTCGILMLEWDAFAEEHEHIECLSERISGHFAEIFKKEFEKIKEEIDNK